MDRDAAKKYVKDGLIWYLRTVKGINPDRVFRCLNPDHNDAHPSMSVDRTSRSGLHCKCFSCNAYYDTFDLISLDYGLSDQREIFNKAYEIFDLQVSADNKGRDTIPLPLPSSETQHRGVSQKTESTESVAVIDFTGEIEAAHRKLMECDSAIQHFKDRGLSIETIEKYKLGYAEDGYNSFLEKHPENRSKSKKESLYKFILPYLAVDGRYTYFLSEIADRGKVDSYNGKYRKISNISAQIFNERYLQQKQPPKVIFICEGVYDALSVEDVGAKAIAFAGTAHERFLTLCRKYKPDCVFVISLDNDAAGCIASEKVKEGLAALGINYIVRTSLNKDFNDDLREDRAMFEKYIDDSVKDAENSRMDAVRAEKDAYMQTSTACYIDGFMRDIEKSRSAMLYPTGFQCIDELLDGGLYAGLYFVGAVSSLGKTTFCLQMIDNIAAAGNDCLVFSLEMARSELMAKSISRLTLLESLKQTEKTTYAKTTRGIISGTRYDGYSQKEKDIINASIAEYAHFAGKIFIYEGVGDIGVDQVRSITARHIRITGNKPVVLIDYLQILAPYNERYTDKQNTDKAVLELKRISRDYSIPVIGISSFNRDSYMSPVSMASFKESGAVEYSSDVLIGLQYNGMDWIENESEKERNRRIRQLVNEAICAGGRGEAQSVQVKVLKNRNFRKGDTCINFYPMYNYFAEEENETAAKIDAAAEGWATMSSTKTPFD